MNRWTVILPGGFRKAPKKGKTRRDTGCPGRLSRSTMWSGVAFLSFLLTAVGWSIGFSSARTDQDSTALGTVDPDLVLFSPPAVSGPPSGDQSKDSGSPDKEKVRRQATGRLPDKQFPLFPSLAPNVAFWERVYSEFSHDQYVLHDRETMQVIAVVDLSHFPDIRKLRNRYLKRKKRNFRDLIGKLAKRLAQAKDVNILSSKEKRLFKALGNPSAKDCLAMTKRLRFQRGQRDRFESGLRRAGKYMARMEKIFKDRRLPKDLTLLPHVESSFDTSARSKVGASGIWQFTRGTGRLFLRINWDLDERNDPILATEAAAKLLRKNFEELRTWPLAITAYNHGLNGMKRAVRKLGTRDLSQIVRWHQGRLFGFASKNFYAEFLAARHVAKNQAKLFPGLRIDPALEFEEIKLKHYVALATLARYLGLPKKHLESLNPALASDVRRGHRHVPKGYRLRLPANPKKNWEALYKRIPAKKLYSRQKITEFTHVVRRGQTLGAIARRYRTSVWRIARRNGLRSIHSIRVGQKLIIPVSPSSAGKARSKKGKNPAAKASKPGVHTVRRGETLTSIARRYGTTVRKLVFLNRLPSPNALRIGQKLRLPH